MLILNRYVEGKITTLSKKWMFGIFLVAIVLVIGINILLKGNAKEEEVINQDFSNVKVESENADINFISTANELAKVELSNNKNNRYKLDVKVKGDTLEINVERKGFRWFSIDFLSNSPTLEVSLPKKVMESIVAETANGTIKALELEVNDLITETNNGEIVLKNIHSKTIFAESDNGDVMIENSEGKILGESSNGDISLITKTLNQPVEFETDNGSINIETTDESKNVMIDVETDNGKVNVFGKENNETVIGSADTVVKLTSDNGDITVK